jgi:cysteine-rich repeat protein
MTRALAGVLVVVVVVVACDGGGGDTARCGDAIVDPGEDCDDGNTVAGDGCFACQAEPRCGDGMLDHITGEQCDDGNTVGGDGCSATCQLLETPRRTTARWSFEDLATSQTTGCPAGFDTVSVVSQPASSDPPIIDRFDCAAGTGITAPIEAGRYLVHLAVTDGTGTMGYALSTSAVVDLTASDATFTTVIFDDAGYFGLGWELRSIASNGVVSCPAAGASDVEISVSNGAMTTSDILPCGDGGGLSRAVLAGSFSVAIRARDAQQQPLGTAPALVNQLVEAPNRVTDLGIVAIPVP